MIIYSCVYISIPLVNIYGLLTVSMRSRWLDINIGRHLLLTALERNSKTSFCLEIFGEFRRENTWCVTVVAV